MTRQGWGRTLALIALLAACSGHVEERSDDSLAAGSAGTAVNPVGGASGTRFGGSSGGGIGGNLGIGGSFGYGDGGTSLGTGGYYGDAGSSFGGTSGGVDGSRCDAVPWTGACTTTQGCIDPHSPVPERVGLNQPVIVDSGPPDTGVGEAGISDATAQPSDGSGPSLIDGGRSDAPTFAPDGSGPVTAVGADICGGTTVMPGVSYLAFEISSGLALYMVAIYSVNQQCSGEMLGVPQFRYSPPPANTWTTQCVELPHELVGRVMVRPITPFTSVRNLRFVSKCACPRPLTISTNCGPVGGLDAGLMCTE